MIVSEHPEWPGTTHRDDLLYIGYWMHPKMRKMLRSGMPVALDYIDLKWEGHRRDEVIAYLELQHEVLYSWSGSSTCRVCDIRPIFRMKIEGEMKSVCFTDGTYAWPGGFLHYVKEHKVRPPERFVDHVHIRRS